MKIGDVEVLTLVEASERSGLSPNTLRAQIKNGVLPATLVGKTYLVTATDIDEYVREHKGKQGPKPRQPKGSVE